MAAAPSKRGNGVVSAAAGMGVAAAATGVSAATGSAAETAGFREHARSETDISRAHEHTGKNERRGRKGR